jgi:hypothetical protein
MRSIATRNVNPSCGEQTPSLTAESRIIPLAARDFILFPFRSRLIYRLFNSNFVSVRLTDRVDMPENGHTDNSTEWIVEISKGLSEPVAICGLTLRLPGGIQDAEGC